MLSFNFTDEGVKVVEILEDISIEELSEKVGFNLSTQLSSTV